MQKRLLQRQQRSTCCRGYSCLATTYNAQLSAIQLQQQVDTYHSSFHSLTTCISLSSPFSHKVADPRSIWSPHPIALWKNPFDDRVQCGLTGRALLQAPTRILGRNKGRGVSRKVRTGGRLVNPSAPHFEFLDPPLRIIIILLSPYLYVINVSATASVLQLQQRCGLVLHPSWPGIH